MATISTHNGSGVSRGHNLRKESIVSKEEHIDPNGIHETWIDEAPRKAYERLFGESVKAYNEKQTRSDRKIDDYYNQIRADQKKHNAYEMIIGVYPAEGETVPEKAGRDILREFVAGWKERNPNLEIIGAYYHADEQGKAPHVHIDYVPVAHGYKNGPETQTALVKALGEQGFTKQGKLTAQIQWEKRENEHLERLCNRRGISIDHPQEGQGVKHLHTKTFKAQKDLERVEETVKEKNKELAGVIEKVSAETQRTVEAAKVFYGDPEEIKKEAKELTQKVADLKQETEELTDRIQSLTNDKETAIKETSKAATEMMKAQDSLKTTEKAVEKAQETLKELQGRILTAEETKSFTVKNSFFGSKAVIEGSPEELQSLVATAQKVNTADKKLEKAEELTKQAQDIINRQGRILQSAKEDGERMKNEARTEARSIVSKASNQAEELTKQAQADNSTLKAENNTLRNENANIRHTIAGIKRQATEEAQKEAATIIKEAYKEAGADRINARLQQMIGLVPQVEVMEAREKMREAYKNAEPFLNADDKEACKNLDHGHFSGKYSLANAYLKHGDGRDLYLRQLEETMKNYKALKEKPHTVEEVMEKLNQRQSRSQGIRH